MDIVKLTEICEIINGNVLHAYIPLGKIISAVSTKRPNEYTRCLCTGFQCEPTYYVKYVYFGNI